MSQDGMSTWSEFDPWNLHNMQIGFPTELSELIDLNLAVRVGQDYSHVQYQFVYLFPQLCAINSLSEQFSIAGVEHNHEIWVKKTEIIQILDLAIRRRLFKKWAKMVICLSWMN